MIFLMTEGVLVSIVGGTLRSTRLKARERLANNLTLEQRIIEIGDEERRRIGHDLHDGLGQHLTGISLMSETMAQQLELGSRPDPAVVETITRLASEAVRITRDLAKSLAPVTLERDGFIAAMEELAETSSTLLNISCHWECDLSELPELERARALHLIRIVQEAVNNSVRHGKARNVRIGLSHNPHAVTLTVTDDGSGLSEKTMANPGIGLRIMQYRAKMLGALLSVERATGAGGTVVTCSCPIESNSHP
jgi:signal transduction histidine kinase